MRSLTMIALLLLVGGLAPSAQAQLFGPRTLGQPFQGRRGPAQSAATSDAGVLEGNERFLRGNRSRNSFVGADRQSQQGFVGAEQAIGTGRVRAATESLTPPPDPSKRVNRPLPPLASDAMYYPRLVVDFQIPQPQRVGDRTVGGVVSELSERLSKMADGRVQVRQMGSVTILSGRVRNQELAEKLMLIASFEPDVDEIENRLVVDE